LARKAEEEAAKKAESKVEEAANPEEPAQDS
jgi:hypothetical protein